MERCWWKGMSIPSQLRIEFCSHGRWLFCLKYYIADQRSLQKLKGESIKHRGMEHENLANPRAQNGIEGRPDKKEIGIRLTTPRIGISSSAVSRKSEEVTPAHCTYLETRR